MTFSCSAGTTRSGPSMMHEMPSRAKPMSVERRCSTPASAMRISRRGDRGEPDERADFDVIGSDPVRRAAELASAVDRELVRADAVDLGAERDEEMTEILHVRLARRVAENGRPARRDRGHERVLGARDARLVEEDVGAAKAGRRQMEAVVQLERRAEPLERQKVRVDAPAADDVAARAAAARSRRTGRAAARREGSTRESSCRASGSRLRRSDRLGVDLAACSGRSTARATPERRDRARRASRRRECAARFRGSPGAR